MYLSEGKERLTLSTLDFNTSLATNFLIVLEPPVRAELLFVLAPTFPLALVLAPQMPLACCSCSETSPNARQNF